MKPLTVLVKRADIQNSVKSQENTEDWQLYNHLKLIDDIMICHFEREVQSRSVRGAESNGEGPKCM